MPLNSQPIDPKFYKKFNLEDVSESEQKIKSQSIGRMFDDIGEKNKINLNMRFNWIWRDVKGAFYDMKYAVRNRFKWRKTIAGLRPWEGFDGIINLMQTHLRDYIETEEKYGHSLE